MIVFPLFVNLFNLWADGDDGVGELVARGEVVDEFIFANDDVFAGTAFVPTLSISSEEDGRARGVIKEVVLDEDGFWRGEEGATGTVVTDGVASEDDGGVIVAVLDCITDFDRAGEGGL